VLLRFDTALAQVRADTQKPALNGTLKDPHLFRRKAPDLEDGSYLGEPFAML
jgi:hypothetical protein